MLHSTDYLKNNQESLKTTATRMNPFATTARSTNQPLIIGIYMPNDQILIICVSVISLFVFL